MASEPKFTNVPNIDNFFKYTVFFLLHPPQTHKDIIPCISANIWKFAMKKRSLLLAPCSSLPAPCSSLSAPCGSCPAP